VLPRFFCIDVTRVFNVSKELTFCFEVLVTELDLEVEVEKEDEGSHYTLNFGKGTKVT
jgi:hypothetical protein